MSSKRKMATFDKASYSTVSSSLFLWWITPELKESTYITLFLTMLFIRVPLFSSIDRPRYTQCIYAQMPGYLRSIQAEFLPAPMCDNSPRVTDFPTPISRHYLFGAYLPPPTFFSDDILNAPVPTPIFELPKLPIFSFLENLIDKVAFPQYTLIEPFFPSSSPHSKNLRPAALTPGQSPTTQFRQVTYLKPFMKKLPICFDGFSPGSSKLG